MKLFYCPVCARVYCLPEEVSYLCGRNHDVSIWADGKARKFVISTKSETNRPPWPVPAVVEEREIPGEELTETWLEECPYPDDEDYGDMRRHFGYGAPGGKHLTREQALKKYSMYVLKPVEG